MPSLPRVSDSRSEMYSLKPQNFAKVGLAQKRIEAREVLQEYLGDYSPQGDMKTSWDFIDHIHKYRD